MNDNTANDGEYKVANGEMLSELRKMAESSDLSPDVSRRLTLSALAEVYSTLNAHLSMDTAMRKCMEDISDKVDVLSTKLSTLETQVKETNDNPLVSFGKHIKEHPKLALAYVIVMTVFITWLPYINLVRLFMLWAGVPTGIVDMLTPAIGGQ